VTIPSPRGRIYDRNGVLLAEDVRAISVAVDNYHVTRPELLEQLLTSHLQIPREVVREKLYRSKLLHVDRPGDPSRQS
jgi:cell division protein FtsI/penicillin-binding protein 2